MVSGDLPESRGVGFLDSTDEASRRARVSGKGFFAWVEHWHHPDRHSRDGQS